MKNSKYYISYIENERAWLLNTKNGNLVNLSRDDYELLENKLFGKISNECLQMLEKSGFLINSFKEIKEKIVLLKNYNTFYEINKKRKTLFFSLVPSLQCNFKCIYCSQSGFKNKKISSENYKKNINSIFRYIDNNFKYNDIIFTLYGGEPFLECNREYLLELKAFVERYKHLNIISINVITNGYNIESFIDIIDYIQTYQITLDGPERVHDSMRTTATKKGTFMKIVSNIKKLIKLGRKIIIRLNFCSDNILYFEELIDYLSNERILEYEKLNLAFFPIYTNENLEFNSKDIDYCFSKIRESKVLNKYFSNYLLTDILKSLSWIKEYNIPYIFNPFQCGAYTNMMLFGPGNNIYGCDHQISEFKHRIGYIGDDILISKYKLLKKRMIKFYYNLKCINCSFFLLCGNSCFIKKRKLISTEDCVMKKFMNNLIILGFERVFLEANIDIDKEDTNDRSKQLS